MMQCCWRSSRFRTHTLAAVGSLMLISPGRGASTEAAEIEPGPGNVSLDRLLTLPSSLPVETSHRGGATRAEWNSRFSAAIAELESAKAALAESLEKLSEMAGKSGGWKVAAPGAQIDPNDNSPIDYGLTQEIRRRREEVGRTERVLRDLVVEANLAGVPEDWYNRPESSESQ